VRAVHDLVGGGAGAGLAEGAAGGAPGEVGVSCSRSVGGREAAVGCWMLLLMLMLMLMLLMLLCFVL
jgi:hypothetical protein